MSSSPLPDGMAIAAETPEWSRQRRRLSAVRIARGSVPYLLILPVLVVIGAVLGYPLYSLVRLSFQQYGLFELIRHAGIDVGLKNYRSVLGDQIFWHTLLRTVLFTIANVAFTMTIGTALALLLLRLSSWVRVLLMSGLVLVWSVPVVVAVQVWYWMTNYQNGVLNYVLTQLAPRRLLPPRLVRDDVLPARHRHRDDRLGCAALRRGHASTPALAQVPRDLVEAAEIDGANPFRVFRDVTVPILMPVLLILTSLSIIWDFGSLLAALLADRPGAHATRRTT